MLAKVPRSDPLHGATPVSGPPTARPRDRQLPATPIFTSEGHDMKAPSLLQLLGITVLAFCLYAIFTDPEKSAGALQAVFTVFSDGVKNLGRFFNSLMS